jgi:hypothetical protein
MLFMHTTLWKSAFGDRPNDPFQDQRASLREALLALRKQAEFLVENISADLRQYTIHDITHLDALWGIASEIVGMDFDLTPTEGFILGGAFLLHDAGMSLAAYPGGLDELKKHRLWPIMIRKFAKDPGRPSETEVSCAVRELLRAEHANRARELPNIEWRSFTGNIYYLIENSELRQKFANSIGDISASHWWSHDKLASALDRILPAPPPFPIEWRADLLKVAAVLRVSDAAHIDERRAPGFVWALRGPTFSMLSNLHWLFQNRLTQPERRDDALYYSSTSDFTSSEAEAWWLANDTLRMIDRELRSTDVLLADLRGASTRLAARRVANIESTATMVNSIRVRDWIPIDTSIKISDVPDLIRSLGGRALYGKNLSVPLRELLQNAADAIRLKTEVMAGFSIGDGRIEARLNRDKVRPFLQIVDNGVGMTRDIIEDSFLNFGNSGWSTDPAFLDYPRADPKKLNMVGKFGIGFFSTFMLGDRVEVTTRRFDRAFEDTLVLSFSAGVGRRPILRQASHSEQLTSGGTSVKVWIANPDELFEDWESSSFAEVCEQQFPLSDIPIFTIDQEVSNIIEAIDWRSVSADGLLRRVNAVSQLPESLVPYLENLRPFSDEDGQVIGRAFVASDIFVFAPDQQSRYRGVVTSRGFSVSEMFGIYGAIEGSVTAANRFSASPKPSRAEFHRWLAEQAGLLSKMSIVPTDQISCASIIHQLGGDTGELSICSLDGEFLSKTGLVQALATRNDVRIVDGYSLRNLDEINPAAKRMKNVLAAQSAYTSVFAHVGGEVHEYEDMLRKGKSRHLEELVFDVIIDCWKLSYDVVRAFRVGGFNGRRLNGRTPFAVTEHGKDISAHGKYIFRDMTLEDLPLADEKK